MLVGKWQERALPSKHGFDRFFGPMCQGKISYFHEVQLNPYYLNDERWKVVVRTCYCSIFDDCWVFDSRRNRPDPVKACPADWTKFEERPNASAAEG